MQTRIFKLLCVSTLTLFAFNGCTDSANPNSGVQTGAVIGGLAGAAIGYNNSGHHSRGGSAAVGGLLGAAVGAGVGSAVDSNNPPPQNTGGWQ